MRVYLDESGCLGFNFSKPYLKGGSSRYLCLAFLFVPPENYKVPSALIASLYKKYGWKNEKKAASASELQKKEFAALVVKMKAENPLVKIDCIVVKKEKIQPHIITDASKIYNYMCKLVVLGHVKKLPSFEFIPDKMGIKVKSGNALPDYLKQTLWFEHDSNCEIIYDPQESHKNYNLQFVDWMAHIVWSSYEFERNEPFKEVYPAMYLRRLYF
jgi:hypothetical protein